VSLLIAMILVDGGWSVSESRKKKRTQLIICRQSREEIYQFRLQSTTNYYYYWSAGLQSNTEQSTSSTA